MLDVGTKTLRFKQFIKGPFSASKFVIRRDYNSSRNGFSGDLFYAVSTNVTAEAVDRRGWCEK